MDHRKHKYKGIRKPPHNCPECWAIYEAKNPKYKTHKTCKACCVEKEVAEFYKAGTIRLKGRCKKCRAESWADWKKNLSQERLDEIKLKGQISSRDWFRRNPNKRLMYLAKTYGLTLDQYNSLITIQDNKCAICSIEFQKPFVDHCHNKHDVRGLLCRRCNTGLGFFLDSEHLLENAILYLKCNASCTVKKFPKLQERIRNMNQFIYNHKIEIKELDDKINLYQQEVDILSKQINQ